MLTVFIKSFSCRLYKITLPALILLSACTTPDEPPASIAPIVSPAVTHTPHFVVRQWGMLPNWQSTDFQRGWGAFLQSCQALKHKAGWQPVCALGKELIEPDNAMLQDFFELNFTPYQVFNTDGSDSGLITGYYEPRLAGSRLKTSRYRYPLYAVPDDLLSIDLGEVYPQLKELRLRGRLQGHRVVPYYNRADIEAGKASLQGRELFWVDNVVELFFLQIQGSGRIELPDGSLVKVGYADQNGYPYVSIGKKLIEMGELRSDEASMQGIKRWGEQNPAKLTALLEQNPSFVFFRELSNELSAPLGALGVPLTEAYSLAVDPRSIPLGYPVFLETTYPNSNEPLHRLMMAQDTGGAIKGAVRGDFFWGFGEQAGIQAGRMKQSGKMWVLFPKGAEPRN
jgi:membrane-bound lytic murein transglycosylase A